MTKSTQRLYEYCALVKMRLDKLSEKQRQLIIAVILLLIALGGIWLVAPIQSAFRRQSAQMAAAARDIKALPTVFQQYIELESQKSALEKEYQEVRIPEDQAVGIIEALIKNTAGIKEGFSVREPSIRDLGGDYKKLSVTVSNLRVNNFPKFVEFLDQIVSGPKTFLLERIDINRSSMGDFFLVSLDISSIQRSQN